MLDDGAILGSEEGFVVSLGNSLGTSLGSSDVLGSALGSDEGNALTTTVGDDDGVNDGSALGLLLGATEGVHVGIGGQPQVSGRQELHVDLQVAATPSIAHKSSELSATMDASILNFFGIALQNENLFAPST